MSRFLSLFTAVRLPLALAMVGLIALNQHLGWGMGEEVNMILAAVAGALGVKRPGDLSAQAVKALSESQARGE